MLLTGCASETDEEQPTSAGRVSEPPPRIGTAPQTLSNTCITASEGNPSQFESVTLTTNSRELIATFEFERPFSLTSEPYSIHVGPDARLILEAGPVDAYALLNIDAEHQGIGYSIRDDVVGGEEIPGADLDNDGDKLILTIPLPDDTTAFSGAAFQWRAEAQGVDCPMGDGVETNWLLSDILMSGQ